MSYNRNTAVLALAFFIAGSLIFLREPNLTYRGTPLNYYLSAPFSPKIMQESCDAFKSAGPAGVRYLIREMSPDPLREKLMELAPRFPSGMLRFLPNQGVYYNRRVRASFILIQLGTNACSALKSALEIAESRKNLAPHHNCLILIGRLAPGTPDEERALAALLPFTQGTLREIRATAYSALGSFTNHPTTVVPVLIKGLKEVGQFDVCSNALKKFGAGALPQLKEEADKEKESVHVRPATAVLEALEKDSRE